MSEQSEKASAYINAACVRASLKLAGMQSRNMQCLVMQQKPMYLEEDFLKVIEQEGISYNDVQSVLYHS